MIIVNTKHQGRKGIDHLRHLLKSQCRNCGDCSSPGPTSSVFCLPLRLSPNVVATSTSGAAAGSLWGTSRNFSGWRGEGQFLGQMGHNHNPPKHGRGGEIIGVRYRSGDRELGETSIMHQEGGEIQEVPLAVLKTKGADGDTPNSVHGGENNVLSLGKKSEHRTYIDLDAREEAAFVEGFNNFTSPQQILKMLETIPTSEVTPFVSLGILRKLFELENNFVYRNDGLPWTISSDNSVMDGFSRSAIVNRLVDTILTTDDTAILLAALNALKCERHVDKSSCGDYRNKFFDEVLLRITTGQFQLNQVCEAIITLGKIELDTGTPHPNSLIDKLWTGVFEKSEDVDAMNITLIFQALPHFKKSRRLVLNLAETKLLSNWWKMDTKAVSKICEILIAEKSLTKSSAAVNSLNNHSGETVGVSNRVLSALSRCTSLNMHQITEAELYTVVRAFLTQNFCDSTFEKALNKYMKAKCLKISDPKLVSAVLEYTKKFHLRSETILEAAAEFIVLHKASNLSPPDLTSIVTAFGHLDFQPTNGVRFWQIVEAYLDEKFIQFTPKDIIEVLLSCVQLMKFPLNFADRMFSPYFLDRVHTSEQDYSHLQRVRSKLKLLDIAMTIECPHQYRGPMLPKDFTYRSIFIDGRILRIGNWLEDVTKEVFGVRSSVEKFIVLPGLPLNASYIADILIANVRRFEAERYNYLKNRIASRLTTGILPIDNDRELTAILIHVPEHYSRDGGHLIGSEVMRIRHFKSMGFNVASVSYSKLSELKNFPSGLRQYIREKVVEAGFRPSL